MGKEEVGGDEEEEVGEEGGGSGRGGGGDEGVPMTSTTYFREVRTRCRLPDLVHVE